MTQNEVVELMNSATSEADWNAKTLEVKRAHGNEYPDYWYSVIIASGLMARVAARFGMDDQIRIKVIERNPHN